MNIFFQPEAEEDIEEMQLYFSQEGEIELYLLVLSRIEKTLALVSEFPEIGVFNTDLNAQEIFVPKTSYKIIFVIQDSTLYVLRVFHTSRKMRDGSL